MNESMYVLRIRPSIYLLFHSPTCPAIFTSFSNQWLTSPFLPPSIPSSNPYYLPQNLLLTFCTLLLPSLYPFFPCPIAPPSLPYPFASSLFSLPSLPSLLTLKLPSHLHFHPSSALPHPSPSFPLPPPLASDQCQSSCLVIYPDVQVCANLERT